MEARGLEPPDLLTASQALYQLSYAPRVRLPRLPAHRWASGEDCDGAGCRRSRVTEVTPSPGGSIAAHGEGLRRTSDRGEVAEAMA